MSGNVVSFVSMDDVVFPAIRPLGGFTPLMCCLCGALLRDRRYVFCEGSLCSNCNRSLPATRQLSLADVTYREGGAT